MRVLLDTTYARRGPSGTGVYITELNRALSGAGVDVIEAVNPRRRPPAGGGWGSVRNLAADEWWTQIELPRRARATGADLLHHPLPALAVRCPVPQVVTVVDLAFERLPHRFAAGYRRWAHLTHRRAARGAAAVVAISRTTAEDAIAVWGVPRSRVVVALLGPGQAPAAPRPPRPRHLLYVGDDEPRKDLPTLLAAYAGYRRGVAAPLPLVLAGGARAHGPGVEMVAGPSAERLAELYAQAAALIQPSLYEGFGLTALEAMHAGTPVMAARSPGLHEICGDAAAYFPPGDAEALTALLIDGPDPALAARGRARAAAYSWDGCARAHLAAYSLAGR